MPLEGPASEPAETLCLGSLPGLWPLLPGNLEAGNMLRRPRGSLPSDSVLCLPTGPREARDPARRNGLALTGRCCCKLCCWVLPAWPADIGRRRCSSAFLLVLLASCRALTSVMASFCSCVRR